MPFSFQVDGHNGEGMDANSIEEKDAMQGILDNIITDANESGLIVTIGAVQPTDWATSTLTNAQGQTPTPTQEVQQDQTQTTPATKTGPSGAGTGPSGASR